MVKREESRSEHTTHIQINKEVIERMKKENVAMDLMGSVLFILICLFENKAELLDCADDYNKERKMHLLYRQLEKKGFLERIDKVEEALYSLTARGNELVTWLREQNTEMATTVIRAEDLASIAKTELESCESWIEEYVNIFPELPKGERMVRMHAHTAVYKMNAFIKKFKYDRDTILAATRAYIDAQNEHPDGHKYTINSNNFISKYPAGHSNYESGLAAWCQKWLSEQNGSTPHSFDTRGLEMV